MDYLDFGSSDSDEEGNDDSTTAAAMDSDEEERMENNRILKMLSIKSVEEPKLKKSTLKMLDFEAEMEAELDRRASIIENEGGLEHQRSLSRSSSSSSLHSLGGGVSTNRPAAIHCPPPGPSCLTGSNASSSIGRKRVKFVDTEQLAVAAGGAESSPMDGQESKNEEEVNSSYDNVYFDSDESDGEDEDLQKRRKAKRKVMSNDELFYDPDSDAADQAWVDKQRRRYHRPGTKKITTTLSKSGGPVEATAVASGSVTPDDLLITTTPKATTSSTATTSEIPPLPSTDAVLNCPACFTVLCMDCQRHEFYSGQFRAMFVMNCRIDRSETLTVPLKNSKFKGRKGRKRGLPVEETVSNVANSDSDKFFPVRCRVCNSQVAVYDSEELYHFFNCLASHP